MFTKLILEASEEVEKERTPLKTTNGVGGVIEKKDEEVQLQLPPKKKSVKDEAELYREFINSQTIIEKVSEYLFDLFDANLTDDFKKMQAFEVQAVQAFDPNVDEFTFEQEKLHRKFCELFEELVSGFLKKEGYTYEEFYEEAKKTIDGNNNKVHNNELIPSAFRKFQPSEKEVAIEIHNVVLSVSDFYTWATEMREIRRAEVKAGNKK